MAEKIIDEGNNHESILCRAWKDTRTWRDNWKLGAFLGFAGLCVTAWGSVIRPWEEALALLYVWVGVAVAYFVTNLVRAPFRQRNEALKERDFARKQLDDFESEISRNDRLRSSLGLLHDSAKDMIAAAAHTGISLEEALAWRDAVTAAFRAEKPEKTAEVKILLSGYPPPGTPYDPKLLSQLMDKHCQQVRAIGSGLGIRLDFGEKEKGDQ